MITNDIYILVALPYLRKRIILDPKIKENKQLFTKITSIDIPPQTQEDDIDVNLSLETR